MLFVAATPGWASWADGLFNELSKDFGPVPHGHLATHPFRVVNRTGGTVHISNVRVSCGCTAARALQTTLAPGQETAILVEMDTRRFFNHRAVTVFVQFDQPRFDEVRLWIQANSRDDVTVIPETLSFGRIKPGSTPTASVMVSFLGDNNWHITSAGGDSNYIKVSYRQTRRSDGEVTFQVTAQMRPETPEGKWFTDAWLTTNNPSMPKLRVPLTVEVANPKKTAPRIIALGKVKVGAEAGRQVILRGEKPFRVTAITGTDSQFQVRDTNQESRSVHVLTLTVQPETPGIFNRTIRIRTDMPNGADIEFKAQAEIMP